MTVAAAFAPVAAAAPTPTARPEQTEQTEQIDARIRHDRLRPEPEAQPPPKPSDGSVRRGEQVEVSPQHAPLPSTALLMPSAPQATQLPASDPGTHAPSLAPVYHGGDRDCAPRASTTSVEDATLRAPQPAPPATTTPMQAGHPDHALYQQIREHVGALDARHGRNFDETSERMTASLLVLAKDNGLDRVDHVLLSNATAEKEVAHYVFVVQGEPGNPAHQRGAMPTAQAAQTPVEESLQQFEVVSQEQQRVQAQLAQQLHSEREQQATQGRAIGMG